MRRSVDTALCWLQGHGPVKLCSWFVSIRNVAFTGAVPIADQLLSSLSIQLPIRVSGEMVCYYRRKPSSTVDHRAGKMPVFICQIDNGINEHGYYGLPEVMLFELPLSMSLSPCSLPDLYLFGWH